MALMDKVKDERAYLWYASEAAKNGWSRNVLVHQIESGLYERQAIAEKVNNFESRLAPAQSELASQMMKDPYIFDFIPFKADMVERDIEKALVAEVTQLLLELGTGFAFLGNQYHLNVGGDDFYIDLLFYNLALRSYVVIELKTGEFKPEYSGESFEQSFPAHVNFVPLETEDGIVVAEETNFGELPAFLYTDLYRGIIHGNIPRRCHNCGRYFLLTNGYDTRYCNNVAPGETERTCRKIGAHVKEQAKHDKMANTPEGKEYLRTYRRLQARRKYGTISTDEWNAQVAEAQSILDRARNGELTEQEMRAAFNAIGGEKRKWARKSGSGS